MEFGHDWLELLKIFLEHHVEFLLVGGHAVSAHGFSRFTEDLDLFLNANQENADRVMAALTDFFGGEVRIPKDQLCIPGKMIMIGVPPFRVDLLTRIDGVAFSVAYTNRNYFKVADLEVPVISLDDLLINKASSGREKDLFDLAELRKRKRDTDKCD